MSTNIDMFLSIMAVLIGIGFILLCVMAKRIADLHDELKTAAARYGVLVDKLNTLQSDIATLKNVAWSIHSDVVDIVDMCDEDGDDEEEDDEEVLAEEDIVVQIDEDPIHLITPNQFFFENNGHEQFNLMYYSDCEELRFYPFDDPDDYIVIDNVSECVGEGLKFFGVHTSDENVAYVRNNVFNADFRIEKVS